MKFQILSDLHLEFSPKSFPIISRDADVLVYAGDVGVSITSVVNYFQVIRKETAVPIIYVLGNHEFYGKFLSSGCDFIRALKVVPDLHVLCEDSIVLGDIRILGTTLWTDFNDRRDEKVALYGMSDFEQIRKSVLSRSRAVTILPADIVVEHIKSREFLDREFSYATNQSQRVVVVTHHGPSMSLVAEQYKTSKLNGAFYVELSNLILREKPVLWVYGHTHTHHQCIIGDTHLICNPWGYPSEKGTNYQEELLFEV